MNTKNRRKDEAVSPVVGVLLMLVVTVIIAAVVSGFAGGLTRSTDKTPQASLDVRYMFDAGLYPDEGVLVIRHLSGEPINTNTTHIVTSWTDGSGVVHFARTIPVETDKCGAPVDMCNAEETGLGFALHHEPYLVDPDQATKSPSALTQSWGNYILNPGDTAKAEVALLPRGTAAGENTANGPELIADAHLIEKGDVINFKLIDMLSGGMIYEKNLRVV